MGRRSLHTVGTNHASAGSTCAGSTSRSVRRHSGEGGTVINSYYLNDPDKPTAGNPADPMLNAGAGAFTTLFVTAAGAIAFGWAARRTTTAYDPSIRAGTATTGSWNVVIARLEAPFSASVYANGTWYTDETYRHACNLANDGGLKPTAFPEGGALYTQYWTIGKGESAEFCGGLTRSLSGDVGECRVYCGQLTDEEIEDLYQEMVTPPVGNAMMFSCNT